MDPLKHRSVNYEFYHSQEWKQTAQRAQIRDHFTCTYPRCSRRKALSVHHITPLLSGGAALDLANLTVLCWKHHTAAHALLLLGKPPPAFCIKHTSSKLDTDQLAAIRQSEKEEKAQQHAADIALLAAHPRPTSQPTSKGTITAEQRLVLLDLNQRHETEPPPKPIAFR